VWKEEAGDLKLVVRKSHSTDEKRLEAVCTVLCPTARQAATEVTLCRRLLAGSLTGRRIQNINTLNKERPT